MTAGHYIFCTAILVGNILIVTQWAKYGMLELALQRPMNRRALTGVVIGMVAIFLGGIAHKKTGFDPWNRYSAAVVIGLTVLVYIIVKWRMPAGQFEFNKAATRIRFWALSNYTPGEAMAGGDMLREFGPARKAVRLMRRAIELQEQSPDSSLQVRLNEVVGHEELGFLYRMMNMWDEAETEVRTSIRLLQTLGSWYPGNREVLRTMSLAVFRLAEFNHARGRTEEAVEGYRASLEMDQSLGDRSGVEIAERLIRRIEQADT